MAVKTYLHCDKCGKTGKPEDFPLDEAKKPRCPRCDMVVKK